MKELDMLSQSWKHYIQVLTLCNHLKDVQLFWSLAVTSYTQVILVQPFMWECWLMFHLLLRLCISVTSSFHVYFDCTDRFTSWWRQKVPRIRIERDRISLSQLCLNTTLLKSHPTSKVVCEQQCYGMQHAEGREEDYKNSKVNCCLIRMDCLLPSLFHTLSVSSYSHFQSCYDTGRNFNCLACFSCIFRKEYFFLSGCRSERLTT